MHRMMSHIFMQIGQHQQKIEHALPLLWNGFAASLFEILHDQQCIAEQPFKLGGSEWPMFAAAIEHIVGANECLVEKMIEAELLANKRDRDRISAGHPSAGSQNARIHDTPHWPQTP